MRFVRLLTLGVLMFGAALVHAEVQKWTFTFGGKPVGQSTFEDLGEGRFQSESNAAIATSKLASKVSGKIEKGNLQSMELEAGNSPNSAKIAFAKGKFSVWSNGKESAKDVAYKPTTSIVLASLNPGLATMSFEAIAKLKSGQTTKVLLLDNFAEVDAKVTLKETAAELKAGIRNIQIYTFNFNGLDVQFAFDSGIAVGLKVPAQMFGAHVEGYEGVFADPVLKYKELSQPTHKVKTETKVVSVLSDGTKLACDIARPDAEGRFPVVLIRTPYGRELSMIQSEFWASRGYVLVAQDVRGRGDSEGEWDPFNREVADGKDTLDWLVKQPWCDGNVGMIGGSYLGMVQWSAAVTKHPALKAIIPQVSPPDPTRNIPWDHGAFMLAGAAWWSRIVKEKDANMAVAMNAIDNPKSFFALPLTQVDNQMFNQNIPFFDSWLRRPTVAEWKGAFQNDQIGKVQIPTLHVSGNWDGDAVGTKIHWTLGRQAGRSNQWLIYGPWEHGFNSKTSFADQDYGPHSILELDSVYLRFFDTYLKGKSVGWLAQPRVKFFVTGANQWFTATDFPFPYAKPRKLFLAGPSAKGAKSLGSLAPAPTGLTKDSFLYDPNKPKYKGDAINPGGTTTTMVEAKDAGPNDLSYASLPFAEDTIVSGPFQAELYVSTTAKDATFHAMVFDQHPDGRVQMLGLPGTKRIWFDALGKPGPIVPNKVYKITIEPWEFAHRFKKGHRLALSLTSDMFPQFARNPGTGEPDWKATKLVKATHSVHRSAKYPSSFSFYSFEP